MESKQEQTMHGEQDEVEQFIYGEQTSYGEQDEVKHV